MNPIYAYGLNDVLGVTPVLYVRTRGIYRTPVLPITHDTDNTPVTSFVPYI